MVEPTVPSQDRGAPLFDAFISYSHAADGTLAPALQLGLEKFAKPWYRPRALRVFRDSTNLSAAPQLWDSIVADLSRARWFLLMASPQAAQSKWVAREVQWWVTHREASRLLILLTEGSLVWDEAAADFDWTHSNAVPPALSGRFAGEPLFIDLRWAKSEGNLTLEHARFRAAVLDLAAPLHGRPKDEMDGEAVQAHRRNRRWAAGAMAGLAGLAVIASAAAWQAYRAREAEAAQRAIAEQQRDRALSRQLAAQAGEVRFREPVTSLLLAAQALRVAPTGEAQTALLRSLRRAPFERIIESAEAGSSLAVSTDGSFAVVAGGQGTLRRVNLPGGEIRDFATQVDPSAVLRGALAVAIAPDGRTVASGGFDQQVRLWDAASGKLDRTLPHLEAFVLALAFSPDARRLASADSAGFVRLWDLPAGTQQVLQKGFIGSDTHGVAALAFSPDGKLLAMGGDQGTLSLFALADRPAPKLQSVAASVTLRGLAFDAAGRRLFCGYVDGLMAIHELEKSSQPVRLDERKFGMLEQLARSPDGSGFVTGHADGTVVIWQLNSIGGWEGHELYRHAGRVTGISGLPDGRRVISTGADGLVVVSRPVDLPALMRERWRSPERFVSLSPLSGSDRLAVLTAAGALRVVSPREQRVLAETRLADASAWMGIRTSRDGLTLALLLKDGTARVMSASTLDVRRRFDTGALTAAALDQRGERLAVESAAGLAIYGVGDGRKLTTRSGEAPKMPPTDLAFTPDGANVLSLRDGRLVAWNASTGTTQGELYRQPDFPVHHLAFSPDGKWLAASEGFTVAALGGSTRTAAPRVALWPAPTGAGPPRTFEAFSSGAPRFSLDGSQLAIAETFASEGSITLWDLGLMQRIEEPIRLARGDELIGYSGVGRRLLVAAADGQRVLEFDADPQAWAAEACSMAGRSLTPEEWRRYLGPEIPFRPTCRNARSDTTR